MSRNSSTPAEIACQQVLLYDSSIYSAQSMVISSRHADRVSPEFLLARYRAHLQCCTLSSVRMVETPEGLEFRLFGFGRALLSFSGPILSSGPTRRSATLRICGGALVQRNQCDRGQLVFAVETMPGGVRVTLELSDYCPLLLGGESPSRLRKLLYRLTQASIHKIVTINYLARLYRELEGRGCVRVVRIVGDEGEEI